MHRVHRWRDSLLWQIVVAGQGGSPCIQTGCFLSVAPPGVCVQYTATPCFLVLCVRSLEPSSQFQAHG